MTEIKLLAIDLAKRVFQLHGIDGSGAKVLERRLMLRWLSTHPWRLWIVTQQQEDLRQAADLAWRQERVTAQQVLVARKVLQGRTQRAS